MVLYEYVFIPWYPSWDIQYTYMRAAFFFLSKTLGLKSKQKFCEIKVLNLLLLWTLKSTMYIDR